MSESTLTLQYNDFMRSVAYYLGFGRKASQAEGLTAAQETICDEYVNAGLRDFYYPTNGYHWSFLTPVSNIVVWPTQSATATDVAAATLTYDGSSSTTVTMSGWSGSFYETMVGKSIAFTGSSSYTITGYTSASVVTVSGDASAEAVAFTITADGSYRLPDDFGGLQGQLTYAAGAGYEPILVRSEGDIRKERARNDRTGTPFVCAHRWVSSDGTAGQRSELLLYPTPDTTYTLQYVKTAHPDKLTTDAPYPLGGMVHGETIKQACLAYAEHMSNDAESINREKYAKMLNASMAKDRIYQPRNLGYNADRQETIPGRHSNVTVTYT